MTGDQGDEEQSAPQYAPAIDDRAPVPETVARALQTMIRRGDLPADARLPPQRDLARRLGVSRASLREALHTLETLGMLRTYPARGTFVRATVGELQTAAPEWRFTASYDPAEVFQSRHLVEGELCRHAAGRITGPELTALASSAGTFERAWHAGDLVGHVEADLAFHNAIAEACGNRMLRDLYASVRGMLAETQRHPVPGTASDRMQESMEEHQTIIDALARHDRAGARQAMHDHIANTANAAGVRLD